MTQSIDASAMRHMNRANVLKKFFDTMRTSRIEISRDLGMNKTTVSSIVDELIQNHFVVEIGYGESQGGRKPVILELNGTAAYIVGIDVQITHVTTSVLSLKGEAVWLQHSPLFLTGEDSVTDSLITALEQEIKLAVTKVPGSPHGVLGVGIALPGMVNANTGYVHYLPNLEIFDVSIAARLAERVRLPVFIDNDANCGALAEHLRSGVTDLAFVNAGTGVGVGIIAHGQLYRGHDGIAGEYGHTTISAMGLRCSCGSYGCWEEYASERGLVRILKDYGIHDVEISDADFISNCIAEARAGNQVYVDAFSELGKYLGIGIANICNAFNPQKVILGGSIALAYQFVIKSIMQSLNQRAVALNKHIQVDLAPDHSVIRGASRQVVQNVIFNPDSTWLDRSYAP